MKNLFFAIVVAMLSFACSNKAKETCFAYAQEKMECGSCMNIVSFKKTETTKDYTRYRMCVSITGCYFKNGSRVLIDYKMKDGKIIDRREKYPSDDSFSLWDSECIGFSTDQYILR